ncbi:hypothetical protein F5887DRAFT_1083271 [Amanita rubescens]|nr:hypothetical protein F5887DRAFT_1083271 [Amanita rubescens]
MLSRAEKVTSNTVAGVNGGSDAAAGDEWKNDFAEGSAGGYSDIALKKARQDYQSLESQVRELRSGETSTKFKLETTPAIDRRVVQVPSYQECRTLQSTSFSSHTTLSHQLTQALAKVQDNTSQLAEQEATYTREANGLRRLVTMMEEREQRVKEIVEGIEKEWAGVGEKAEKNETLETILDRMRRGELPQPSGRNAPSTPQDTIKTFTEVYADYVRLQDEYAQKCAEYDQTVVLAQIEERKMQFDMDTLITKNLALFKYISGLQEQNQKLPRIVRELSSKMELREAHDAMQDLAARLERQKKDSENIIQSYVKERDALKAMLSRAEKATSNTMADVNGGSAAAGVEGQSDLVKELAEEDLELHIATGRIEQLHNERVNFRAEKKIWKFRLVEENKTLALERAHLFDLMTNVQKMYNDLERAGENDRRRLESQLQKGTAKPP